MTPCLPPGCSEELLITRNTLREVKQKGQAGREVNPSHDSPPVSTGTPSSAHVLGRTGSARLPCRAGTSAEPAGLRSRCRHRGRCQRSGTEMCCSLEELEVTCASFGTGLDRVQLNHSQQTFVQSIFRILPLSR